MKKIKLEQKAMPEDVTEIIRAYEIITINPLVYFGCDFSIDIQEEQNKVRVQLFEKYSIDEVLLVLRNKETYKKDYSDSLYDSLGNLYRDPFIRVTKAGSIIDVVEKSSQPLGPGVIRVDKEHYINIRRPLSVAFDAEDIPKDVYEYKNGFYKLQKFNPSEVKDVSDLRKTFKRLRDIINSNTENPKNCLWVTLTYADNIQGKEGNEKLYSDFKRAMTRLRRYTQKEFKCSFEYISVVEPQGRGAWHCHLILIFPFTAPFIDNSVIAGCWDQGFTKTTKMNTNVDNLGAYLTAYLSDIPVEDIDVFSDTDLVNLSSCKWEDKNGKKYIKGGRLYLYPLNMKLYRTSRGIKHPEILDVSREELNELTDGLNPQSQSIYEYEFDNGHKQVLRYTHYNKNKK